MGLNDYSQTDFKIDHVTIAVRNNTPHSERLMYYNSAINAGFKSAGIIYLTSASILDTFQDKMKTFCASRDKCVSNVMVVDLKKTYFHVSI